MGVKGSLLLERGMDDYVSDALRVLWELTESFVLCCNRKNSDESVALPPPLLSSSCFCLRASIVRFLLPYLFANRRSTGNLQPGEVITVNGTEVMGTQQMVSTHFFIISGQYMMAFGQSHDGYMKKWLIR